MTLGKALRAWRVNDARLSLRELARLCGRSAVIVGEWERDVSKPDERDLHALERAGFVAPASGADR